MKIRNGVVTIQRGDSLVGVSIVGIQVRIETERELEGVDLNAELISILEEMDVSTRGAEIRDCSITTNAEIAKRHSRMVIKEAMLIPKSAIENIISKLPWNKEKP